MRMVKVPEPLPSEGVPTMEQARAIAIERLAAGYPVGNVLTTEGWFIPAREVPAPRPAEPID